MTGAHSLQATIWLALAASCAALHVLQCAGCASVGARSARACSPRACAAATSSPSAVSTDYGADQITVLEGLEPVRKRPGMYIGSTGPRGLHHLAFEVVDNSVDEALAGWATEVNVTMHADGRLSVADNGRGIPCDLHAKTGKPALETVLTILHAGGKFGGGGSGYKVTDTDAQAQTHRHRQTVRLTETHTQTHRYAHRNTDKYIYTYIYMHIYIYIYIYIYI